MAEQSSDKPNEGEQDTDTKPGGESQNSGKVEFTPEQQTAINRMIAEQKRQEREKWEREREDVIAQEKKDAETKRLKEQEEYKALSEQQEQEIADLKAQLATIQTGKADLEGSYNQYKSIASKMLETERQGLPDHIIALLDKLDPVEQLDYIAANADEIRKGKGAGIGNQTGPTSRKPPTPLQQPKEPLIRLPRF